MSNTLLSLFFAAGIAGFAYSKLGRRVGYGNEQRVWTIVGVAFVLSFAFFLSLFSWVIKLN